MFNFNNSKQKSPQQRFLFILGLAMMIIYLGISIVLIFFSDLLGLDPDRFPRKYQIAFAIVLIVYAAIRFFRIIRDNRIEE
jgi:uncharacterized membrane protein (DUF485 family)